jgi:HD-GYP domain-containing protein (c-di-GMP phosphodiesterase class II)
MTLLAAEPSAIFTEFSQRALDLGVPCWCCDRDGEIIGQTRGSELAAALAQSDRFRAGLKATVRDPSDPDAAVFFTNRRFLQQADSSATIVALVLSSDSAERATVAEFCLETGHREAAEELLAPSVRRDREQVDQIIAVLKYFHRDLCSAADDRRLSDQFTRQLSQSYEGMNVLFRMGRCLNSSSDADAVTKNVCDELARVLPFSWVAIWFREGEQVLPELAGRLTASGTLPCTPELLIEQGRRLCDRSASQPWTHILLRDKNELATLARAEVLAEAISRGRSNVGVLLAGNKQGDDQDVSSEETQLLSATANFISVFHENMARFADLRGQFIGTIHCLSAAIDAKDPYTCGHSDRVALLASKMAAAMGMDRETVEQYRIAGLLHDVGNIGVPESALCKMGRLTDDEFAQIKRHPEIGYKILHDIPAMEQILPGVLHHHERWDGHGYPRALPGEKISMIGRCLALADTFDAMSSNRSYRKAMQRDVVLAEIKRTAGSQFDPKLADVFLSLDFHDFEASLAT